MPGKTGGKMIWSTIPVVGKILDGVIGLVDKAVPDRDEARRIKADLSKVFDNSDLSKFSEQIQAQAKIITAEAKSESWIARNWRPMIMLLFGVIIANNYILYPWFSELFDLDVMMPVPAEMWGLLKLGLGGYVIGRTVEKGIKVWKDRQ